MAVAIAYRAIQNGFDALCTTAAALIEDLSVASRDGLLRQALAEYVRPHVLLVDDVGYLACGDDAANLLFHVVNERHLKLSTCGCRIPRLRGRSTDGEVKLSPTR